MNLKQILVAIVFLLFVSCKKETVYVDVIPTPKTSEELLTAHTWKTDEVRAQVSNGTTQYYLRGASGNTVNYDSDSIKFTSNNTAAYYYLGSQYSATWNFTNSDKSKMTVVINFPTAATLYLENVTLGETTFTYSQYITSSPTYLASVRRTPN